MQKTARIQHIQTFYFSANIAFKKCIYYTRFKYEFCADVTYYYTIHLKDNRSTHSTGSLHLASPK